MKTLFIVIDLKNNHIVGAYPTLETTEYEITANALKKIYDIRTLFVKQLDEVEDEIYDNMIFKFKPKHIWH